MENGKKETDKVYSTYWWVMKLDPNHPANHSQKVNEMTGYSKFAGHDEAKNKAELLMKKIIMLHSWGYFEKSLHITFYMRQGIHLNKANSVELFKLDKKQFEINDRCKSDQRFYTDFFLKQGILNFLTRFYEFIANNKNVKQLLPDAKPTFSKDDYLDPSKHTFKTRTHLYAYCEKLLKNKHPYEAVIHFQRKYEERKPFIE